MTPEQKQKLTERLAAQVSASRTDGHLATCVVEAAALLSDLVGDRREEIPDELYDLALIECAADLYWRRQARNGIATFDGVDGIETVNVRRDPLTGSRDVLAHYLGVGIA